MRCYGKPPYSVALVHGGPGAAGEMAPVARMLCDEWGILEPFQSARTIEGQIEELAALVASHAPLVFVGHSWGAHLVYLLAGSHPERVRGAILVASSPFEAMDAARVMPTRLARLTQDERQALEREGLSSAAIALIHKADSFDADIDAFEPVQFDRDAYESVGPELKALRESGELLRRGRAIQCPVVVIHGDHDPHPASGVELALRRILRDFRMVLLKRCGHTPWTQIATLTSSRG